MLGSSITVEDNLGKTTTIPKNKIRRSPTDGRRFKSRRFTVRHSPFKKKTKSVN
jgi:hypothetical protein